MVNLAIRKQQVFWVDGLHLSKLDHGVDFLLLNHCSKLIDFYITIVLVQVCRINQNRIVAAHRFHKEAHNANQKQFLCEKASQSISIKFVTAKQFPHFRQFLILNEVCRGFGVLGLLCAMLPQYGILSRPMRKLQQDPQAFGTAHHLAHRTTRYFTPYIFDNFVPHFTLLNPFVSANPSPIFEACQMLFTEFSVVEVQSICLVNLSDDAPWYHIVHEFDRGQFPRPYPVTST